MKIGIVTLLYNEKPLEEVARYISSLGYQMVELAAWKASPHFDLDACLSDKAYGRKLKAMLSRYGLEISVSFRAVHNIMSADTHRRLYFAVGKRLSITDLLARRQEGPPCRAITAGR